MRNFEVGYVLNDDVPFYCISNEAFVQYDCETRPVMANSCEGY